jgi:hypothetical protein
LRLRGSNRKQADTPGFSLLQNCEITLLEAGNGSVLVVDGHADLHESRGNTDGGGFLLWDCGLAGKYEDTRREKRCIVFHHGSSSEYQEAASANISGVLPVLVRQDANTIDSNTMGDVNHRDDVFELQFFCAIHEKDSIRAHRK